MKHLTGTSIVDTYYTFSVLELPEARSAARFRRHLPRPNQGEPIDAAPSCSIRGMVDSTRARLA